LIVVKISHSDKFAKEIKKVSTFLLFPSYVRMGSDDMKIFENIINHKINNITSTELLKYSKQFKIKITNEETVKLANHLNGRKVNIFNPNKRAQLIREVAKLTSPATAKELNDLFNLFAEQ